MVDRYEVALTIEGIAYIAFTEAINQPTVEQQIDAVRALFIHSVLRGIVSADPRMVKWLIKNQEELMKQLG